MDRWRWLSLDKFSRLSTDRSRRLSLDKFKRLSIGRSRQLSLDRLRRFSLGRLRRLSLDRSEGRLSLDKLRGLSLDKSRRARSRRSSFSGTAKLSFLRSIVEGDVSIRDSRGEELPVRRSTVEGVLVKGEVLRSACRPPRSSSRVAPAFCASNSLACCCCSRSLIKKIFGIL